MSATSEHSRTIAVPERPGTREFQCEGEGMSRGDWAQPSSAKNELPTPVGEHEWHSPRVAAE